ncbi:MAG: hypothetical protein K5819_08740 [Lachnospiraceae bacterium]|nr:hypothetical protein [Lachnospiraceae bacterium]
MSEQPIRRKRSPEELRLLREKRHRQIIRRRKRMLFLVILLILIGIGFGIAALNGVFEKRSKIDLLTLKPDGTVVYEENASLKDGRYNAKELKAYVKDQIESYNASHEDGDVKLNRFAAGKDHVYLRTTYKSVAVYSDFTGYEMYSGKVADAKKAGYSFADTYRLQTGKHRLSGNSMVSGDAKILGDKKSPATDARVLIIKENTAVKVDGSIYAVSSTGTKLLDEDTVEIASGDEDDTLLTYIFYN